MQNLDDLILGLFQLIGDQSVEIPEKTLKLLSENYPKEVLLEYFKKLHQKNHKDIMIKIKYCDKLHCIECLLNFDTCEHGQKLTLYEKNFARLVATKGINTSLYNVASKMCQVCKINSQAVLFMKQSCKCECLNCIRMNLTRRGNSCKICQVAYDLDDLIEFFSRFGLEFPGIMRKCASCGIFINTLAFCDDECYVCYSFQQYYL